MSLYWGGQNYVLDIIDQPDLAQVLLLGDLLPPSPGFRPSLLSIRQELSPPLSWLGILPNQMTDLKEKLRLLLARLRSE